MGPTDGAPAAANTAPVPPAQSLSEAGTDADKLGAGNVGDPASSCQGSPAPTPPPAHIAVHVQDPLGNPVANASVQVVENGMSGVTSSTGDYDFGDVPPGTYTVTAKLDVSSATSQPQSAPSAATTVFTLTLPWTLVAHWVDTQVYCGDNATLEIGVVPVPASVPATVEVLHPASGATIATFGATLTGGSSQFVWMAKAQTANWRTDQIDFRVTVTGIGLTGNASNKLTFRARPTTGWTTLENNHGSSGNYAPIYEYVDASLEASQVHYSLKIRLTAEHFWQSMPWDATRQAAERSNIEAIWNNGFSSRKFHRKSCGRGQTCDCAFDCCKAGFHLDVNFVTSGEHYAVEIWLTSGRCATSRDGSYWNDPAVNPSTQYAHEVGHMIGNFDEYAGGGNDPAGVEPAVATTPNLMSTGGVATLFNVHFRWVLAYLNANDGGDPYEIVPP